MFLISMCQKDHERWESGDECKKMLDEFEDPVIKDKVKNILEKSFTSGFFSGVGAALRDEDNGNDENDDDIENNEDDKFEDHD